MVNRIENVDDITPREVYDRGFDAGYQRGLEVAAIERLRYQHIMRQNEYLLKKLGEFDMMRPRIIQITDGPHRLISTAGD